VFVRSPAQIPRATAAVSAAGLAGRVLDNRVEIKPGHVSIATMHLAKGLEFRAVAVMACDDEVLPLQERIETSATMVTCRRCTRRNGSSCTWRAREREIDFRSAAWNRRPSFWTT
jgi:superfamily I DNA/RNA helicase